MNINVQLEIPLEFWFHLHSSCLYSRVGQILEGTSDRISKGKTQSHLSRFGKGGGLETRFQYIRYIRCFLVKLIELFFRSIWVNMGSISVNSGGAPLMWLPTCCAICSVHPRHPGSG
jgi:hypothetical protein